MLSALFIENIVLIDRLSLALGKGLTALTGETGAGKSILLDALSLATGGRAERGMIRQNCAQAIVSATFEPPSTHPVWDMLRENGISCDEPEIILRRVLGADGRARAFINDQPVSVSALRKSGDSLIEVHGQHQGQSFLNPVAHRGLLDQYGALEKQSAAVAAAYTAWQAADKLLTERCEAKQQAEREHGYLRHVVEELGHLAPRLGEENELAARRAHLMAAEKIARDLGDITSLVSDGALERGLVGALARLEKISQQLGDQDGDGAGSDIAQLVQQVDSLLTELNETNLMASRVQDSFDTDEKALDEIEQRLFALRAAARKYNVTPDGLVAFLAATEQKLSLLEDDQASIKALEKEVWATAQSYDKAAGALCMARRQAALNLDKAVAKELKPLKLGDATFHVEVKQDKEFKSPHGQDHVQFLISTNPGAPLGPLKQIASGGELSRFVLALKAALMAKEDRTIIIFDEVDAGVGGAVADAVGERLAKLAKTAQVMVVTHSPQVAARADAHWSITKAGRKYMTTKVRPLPEEERVEEIARMLSGAKITEQARAAARSLLAGRADVQTGKRARAS